MLVAANGTGDFKTIQEAINSIPKDNDKEAVIEIKSGVYKEKLIINKPFVTLKGEGKDSTVLTYDDYARKIKPDGTECGTTGSTSVLVDFEAHDFKAYDITFENSADNGNGVGQAVAIKINADRCAFYNCGFTAYQDTLYAGPAPQKEGEPDITARQYYENCYISGDVDFIFGSATAIFYKCVIEARGKSGYLTAASTHKNMKFGYVFMDCDLISNLPENSVYLGRPWRQYASTVFINCRMGAHIRKVGWNDWKKDVQTVYYAEYGCTGDGADTSQRADWSKQLTDEEVKNFTFENIFDGWSPQITKEER